MHRLIDGEATEPAVAVFRSLRRFADRHVLFGHQYATDYWSAVKITARLALAAR